MGEINAVVLDFDGVLAESNAVKDAAFGDFFARHPDFARKMQAYHDAHHAKPRRFKFAYFVEELMNRPGDGEMIDCMADEFSALVCERVIACPEVPGAMAFLEEFAPQVPLYISSVTPQGELERIVAERGVAPHVQRVFGDPPHPKREAIRWILDRERLRPEQAAFVGDSESDRQVALDTGLAFFARDSGQSFAEPALELSADLYGVAEKLRSFL